MDKTLKRQIGYRAPAHFTPVNNKVDKFGTPLKETVVPKKPPVSKKKIAAPFPKTFTGPAAFLADHPNCKKEATAKQVVAWIKDHPLFKWGGMCAQLGLHKGNFWKEIQSQEPKIKPEIVAKIVEVIKEYGFPL